MSEDEIQPLNDILPFADSVCQAWTVGQVDIHCRGGRCTVSETLIILGVSSCCGWYQCLFHCMTVSLFANLPCNDLFVFLYLNLIMKQWVGKVTVIIWWLIITWESMLICDANNITRFIVNHYEQLHFQFQFTLLVFIFTWSIPKASIHKRDRKISCHIRYTCSTACWCKYNQPITWQQLSAFRDVDKNQKSVHT